TCHKSFEGNGFSQQRYGDNGHVTTREESLTLREGQARNLIFAYRSVRHLKPQTNPVRPRRDHKVHLALSDVGLSEADLDTEFDVGAEIQMGRAKLRDIIAKLEAVYLGPIGFEVNFIRNEEIRQWLLDKIER